MEVGKNAVHLSNPKSTVEKLELSISKEKSSLRSTYKGNAVKNIGKGLLSSSPDLETTTCCCCNISPKVSKCLEISALTIGIVIVLILLSIPIITHINQDLKKRQTNIKSTNTPNTTNTTCSGYGSKTCLQKELSWSLVPAINNDSKCHAKVYSGSACSSYLLSWQTCALGGSTSVFVNDSSVLSEEKVKYLITQLAQLPDSYSSCKTTGAPFLCQYIFPLCDCATGDLYSPSRETCEEVSTVTCRTLWPLLEKLIQPLKLPDCSALPVATYPSDTSGSGNSSPSPTTGNSSLQQDTVCDDQFIKVNGTCYARCDSFEQSPHDVTVALDIIQIFAASYGITVGVIVLIISIVRWKTMLCFPSIFIVYMTTACCIIALFIIISPINRSKLYCSSDAITKESFNNPTIFCIIAGAVFHYFFPNITLWWFFHVCSIFYKVVFPLKSKQYEKKEKYIHVVLVLAGIFIPIPGLLLALVVPDWGYIVNQYPPFICSPKNPNFWYYTAMLPFNILLAIGASMFVFMFWTIHKHQGIFPTRNKSSFSISTAERKILFVLCYYVIFGVVILAHYGVITANLDLFKDALEMYFRCQALGHPPNQTSQCDQTEYQQYIHPELAATGYLMMGLIPSAHLTFVIDWKTTFDKLMSFFQYYCHFRIVGKKTYSFNNADKNETTVCDVPT